MTDRQREIARLVVLGSVEQAAATLQLHPYSVRRHLSEVYKVCGVRSLAELVGWCVAHSVVTVKELRGVYGDHKVGQGTEREPEGAPLTGQIRR